MISSQIKSYLRSDGLTDRQYLILKSLYDNNYKLFLTRFTYKLSILFDIWLLIAIILEFPNINEEIKCLIIMVLIGGSSYLYSVYKQEKIRHGFYEAIDFTRQNQLGYALEQDPLYKY